MDAYTILTWDFSSSQLFSLVSSDGSSQLLVPPGEGSPSKLASETEQDKKSVMHDIHVCTCTCIMYNYTHVEVKIIITCFFFRAVKVVWLSTPSGTKACWVQV